MNVFRLDTDHINSRVDGFQSNCNTGNQTAAADWNDNVIDVIQIFKDFQTDSPLTCDYFFIIVWRDKDTAFLLNDLSCFSNRVIEVITVQNNFCRVI
ncbi:Uncharacterised protein [Klebsiella pneumoniae]|nr:Uncharacterised protein [Klebsiella pneumoniae]